MTNRAHDSGVTLIELILVIAVIGIISGTIVNALVFWNSVGRGAHTQINLQQDLTGALNRLVDGTKSVPGLLTATDIVTASESTLTYKLPSGQQVTYTLNGSNLNLSVDSISAGSIIGGLTSFSTNKLSENQISMSLSGSINTATGPRIITASTTVKLRNR
jgi:prepilin-type N-terminal cleavage/methylation domain-containing protein